MKEQNENEKKKITLTKEKKFYLFTAVGCAAVLLAIIIVAIAVTNNNTVEPTIGNNTSHEAQNPTDSTVGGDIDSGSDNQFQGLIDGVAVGIGKFCAGGIGAEDNRYLMHQLFSPLFSSGS